MAKRKRAKSWAQYERQMAVYRDEADSYMADKERIVRNRPQDAARVMYEPRTIRNMKAQRQFITPSVAGWYKNNAQPTIPSGERDEDDPQGDEAIRNNVMDAINGQLLTPEQRSDQAAMESDPELARKILAEKASEMEQQKPALLEFLETLSSGYMWANHQLTHPFTAASILTNTEADAYIGNGNPLEQLSEAWDQSSAVGFFEGDRSPKNPYTGKPAVSIGQASISNPLTAGAARLVGLPAMETGDPNSEDQQDYFNKRGKYENDPTGMAASGFLDVAQQSVGDGLAIATKGMRLGVQATKLGATATRGDQVAHIGKLANMLESSRAGAGKNALGDLSDWLVTQTGPKGEAAIRTRLKKMGAGDRADVAHMLARTDNREKMDLLLRASWNDKGAIKELRDVDTAAYVQFMRRNDSFMYDNAGAVSPWVAKPNSNSSQLSNESLDKIAEAVDASPTNKAYVQMWDRKAGARDPITGTITGPKPFDVKFVNNKKLVDDYVTSMAERNGQLASDLDMDNLGIVGALGQANLTSRSRTLGAMKNKSSVVKAESDFGFAKGARLTRYNESKWAIPINILRWPAREKPNGLVGTVGISKEGSTNEIEALLNSPAILRDSRFAELKNGLMSHWGANSHLDARASGAVQHIEASVMQAMAEEYGKKALATRMTPSDPRYADELQKFVDDKMQAFVQVQRQRDAAHMSFNERGYAIDQSGPSGPEIIKSPELAAHLRESVPVLDMQLFERNLKRSAKDSSFKWTADEVDKLSAAGKAVKLNSAFQSVWRPAVLLRAAYPIRNSTEGYARVLGFVGLSGVWQDSLETVGNIAANTGRRAARRTGSVGRANSKVNDAATALDDRMLALGEYRAGVQAQVDEIAAKAGDSYAYDDVLSDLRAGVLDAADESSAISKLNGDLSFDLATHLDDVTHLGIIDDEIAGLQSNLSKAQDNLTSKATNRHIGSGTITRTLPDGSTVTVNNVFEGKLGEVALGKASNDDSWAYMSGAVATRREGEMRKRLQVVDGMVTADNIDDYSRAVFDASNKIFRDSVVTQMRLDPTKTSDDFLEWFYSKEGRFEREAQHQFGRNVAGRTAMATWFDAGRENLLKTFPDQKFRDKIAAGVVTESDVERYIATVGPDNLPPVIGDVIFDLHGATKEGGNWWARFTQKAFRTIGAVPENTLVRQPYYKTRFMEYMDGNLLKLDAELADNADVLAKITNEAHRYALRRLRRDIYTIERQRNLPSIIEQVSPFWTAQINTATTWPRIFAERPETIAGIARTYTRMRESGMIDDEGYFNPIPGYVPTVGGMDIRIPFVNVLSMFAGTPSEEVQNMPGGAVIGFFAPSAGPQMQVIVSEMQKGTPGFKQIADVIPDGEWKDRFFAVGNPMGISTEFGSLDMLLPTWGRQALAGISGEGNGTYDAMAAKITQNELAKYDQGLRSTYPTKDEIGTMTNQVFATLLVGAFTAPGSPRAVSPMTSMVDVSRGYMQKYGYFEGTTKFLEVYGEEWAAALTRGSKNNLGFPMQQNQDTLKLIRDNPKLVEKIAGTGDTEMISLLMGAGELGEYDESGTARRVMLQSQIPGSDKNMLEMNDPEQIMRAHQLQRGFREFRKEYSTWRDAKVDTWIKQYGSTEGIPSEKWSELTKKREAVVADLKMRNEVWGAEWGKTNDSGRKALKALREIRSDPKFWAKAQSEPYWQTVSDFVDLHDETAAALKGGKPKNQAQTPEQFFEWNRKNNAAKGYNFSPAKQAEFRKKVMKEFETPGTERNKQWQLAKYKAGVEDLRRRNIPFGDMFDRWFKSEDYDDNAF